MASILGVTVHPFTCTAMQTFIQNLGFISGGSGTPGRIVWRSQTYVGYIIEKGEDWFVSKDGREIPVKTQWQLVHALTTIAYDEGVTRGKKKLQEDIRALLGVRD